MFLCYQQNLYQQIKQKRMYKKSVDNAKHNNLRNIEQFFNIKKTNRHSSHKKTKPISISYQATIEKQHSLRQTQEGPVLYSFNDCALQVPQKGNSDSVQLRKRRLQQNTEQILNLKKNAYRNYIRQIYIRINEELRKKNSFFSIASQNIKQINYTDVLITKEVKPAYKSEEGQISNLKKKLRQKLKLEKLQEETASLEKMRQKLFSIKTNNKKKVESKTLSEFHTQRIMQKTLTMDRNYQSQVNQLETVLKIDQYQQKKLIPKTVAMIHEKKKQKVFSLNIPMSLSKINAEDYIPAKKLFNKKDPFVCGLHSDKQSVQQKNRQKLLCYIDFLWKLNYSNSLFVKPTSQQVTYKAFIGNGNNSLMVKTILKRRYWWTIADKSEGCNFIWTQLKQNFIFKELQEDSQTKKQNTYVFNQQLFSNHLSENTESFKEQHYQEKIFNKIDDALWMEHLSRNSKTQNSINQKTYMKRVGLLAKKNIALIPDSKKILVHNHLEQNFHIGNKKALFYHMKKYYSLCGLNLFDALPLTFHIIKGIQDPEYKHFLIHYNRFESLKKNSDQKNIWILKPGQFSNRGNGITVCHSLDDILIRLKSKQKSSDGNLRTFIIQKYIQKPLLYKGRKFDIRHYLLLTCFNGCIKAYWYPEGYIRTASSTFTLKRGGNLFVHLTNDAIQKNSEQYGKYQKGNKISYEKFQAYLDKHTKDKLSKNIFFEKILPRMKELTQNAVKSTYLSLDEKRKQHNFELLGMDFMIDESYKPWLIQINTNPCLELSCPLLARLIPSVVQDAFKICVDPLFPPPEEWVSNKKIFVGDNALEQNKFELIFDEIEEGKTIQKLFQGDYNISGNVGKIEQDAQVYQNEGQEQWQGQGLKKQE